MICIAHNAVAARVVGAPKEALLEIHRLLSYRVEGAEHMAAFSSSGGWNGRSSFFNWSAGKSEGTFPTGFVRLVVEGLRKIGHDCLVRTKPLPEPLGPDRPVVDVFGYTPRYDYQPQTVDLLVRHGNITVQVATGGGKCLGRGTPVLMYDGTVKAVQDVVQGDWLMGPDSGPRRVLSTCAGVSPLYRVVPVKGDPYVVNDAHILSLKQTCRGNRGRDRTGPKYPKGEIVNINVEDYLSRNKTFKHVHKGWRTGVDFEPGAPLSIDPYLLGVILGDGTINGTISVTTADSEIMTALREQAVTWGLKCNVIPTKDSLASAVCLTSGRTGGQPNNLMLALREIGFVSRDRKACAKFIPHRYKTSSRSDRLALLAGIIDTDGTYDGKGFHISFKSETLFDDTLFLVRSLGFAAYKSKREKTCCNNGVTGWYFHMAISGDLDTIPTRIARKRAAPRRQVKNPLVTGISVEAIGSGEYFGFEIDGDHLFMLGDFTVTHNTRIAKMAYKRIDRPTLFLTTRGILLHQMKASMEKDMGEEVAVLGDGEWGIPYRKPDGTEGRRITKFVVAMVQTLAQRLEKKSVEVEYHSLQLRRAKDLAKRLETQKADLKASKTPVPEIGRLCTEFINRYEAQFDEAADRQSIQAKVDKHERLRLATIEILKRFELVIAEEAHEISGSSFYNVMCACGNAYYRLALTATPFMKDDEEANLKLLAACGPVAIQITEKMLIDRGILAKPYFKYLKIGEEHRPPKLSRSTPYAQAVERGIVNFTHRNKLICAELLRAWSYGLNGMILVQRKDHGAIFVEILQSAGARVVFIQGEDNQAERSRALQALGNGDIDFLVGTTILDVGVDVPSVGIIANAGGGKAEVALRQRIGRGLREKKGKTRLGNPMPNVALVVDVYDELNNHLKMHAGERQAIVKGTPGFAENIVPDFDYAAMGLTKKAA